MIMKIKIKIINNNNKNNNNNVLLFNYTDIKINNMAKYYFCLKKKERLKERRINYSLYSKP